jgi:hypothetical protein
MAKETEGEGEPLYLISTVAVRAWGQQMENKLVQSDPDATVNYLQASHHIQSTNFCMAYELRVV